MRRWDYDPKPRPAPPPRGRGGDVPDDQKDFIVLEYVANGDLRDLIAKVNAMNAKFPDRVLWSFFLCLVKQCIGLAYYPRKFHPDRHNAGDGRDLDETIPPDAQKWRWKNMIHFDYDPLNSEGFLLPLPLPLLPPNPPVTFSHSTILSYATICDAVANRVL